MPRGEYYPRRDVLDNVSELLRKDNPQLCNAITIPRRKRRSPAAARSGLASSVAMRKIRIESVLAYRYRIHCVSICRAISTCARSSVTSRSKHLYFLSFRFRYFSFLSIKNNGTGLSLIIMMLANIIIIIIIIIIVLILSSILYFSIFIET